MKIISQDWVTSSSICIGIVVTENEMGVRKIRIDRVSGHDEAYDAKCVAEEGATIDPNILTRLLSIQKGKKNG